MKTTFFALLIICLIFSAFKCEEDSSFTLEEDKKELEALRQTIEDLANASVCNENTECKYIAFGSKACGGPRSYLVYSTSIDGEALETLVEEYNQKETDFNTKHGIISDCALVMPPTGLSCENNTCIAIY